MYSQIFKTKPKDSEQQLDIAQAPPQSSHIMQHLQPTHSNHMPINTYPGPKPQHSQQYLRGANKFQAAPPVTHVSKLKGLLMISLQTLILTVVLLFRL